MLITGFGKPMVIRGFGKPMLTKGVEKNNCYKMHIHYNRYRYNRQINIIISSVLRF